jgi:quercetin dioxygenase-like cupin family protein
MKIILPLLAVTVSAASLSLAGAAQAGQCPAGQMRPDARTAGETTPAKVTDTELSFVNLGTEIRGLDQRRLRLRRLVVQPGGVVPWHSHTDRPALIMTVSGAITEYRSTCAVGIDHPAGDVAQEVKGVSHWWKNNGKVPAVLLAADIKNDGAPPDGDHM